VRYPYASPVDQGLFFSKQVEKQLLDIHQAQPLRHGICGTLPVGLSPRQTNNHAL
jgi:hypothetical protein